MTKIARHVGLAEAKAKLSNLVRQVEAGSGPLLIDRHGHPVAVLDRYHPEAEPTSVHWADALDAIALDVPGFEESLAEIVASREQSLPRPFDLD